jgi:hypothetical protein
MSRYGLGRQDGRDGKYIGDRDTTLRGWGTGAALMLNLVGWIRT